MATIIIALLIAFAVFMGLRSFIKGKGSCGDCNCSCPVKDSQHKNVICDIDGVLMHDNVAVPGAAE